MITIEKKLEKNLYQQDIEVRINNILEHATKGIFTLEDAKEFAEISPFIKRKRELNELSSKSSLIKQYEHLQDIYWKKFYWITGTLETLLILGILHEKNKPYTKRELEKKILELEPSIHPLSFEAALEILVKHGYVNPKRTFFKKVYELTKKGEITITLVKHRYEEVRERIIGKYQ